MHIELRDFLDVKAGVELDDVKPVMLVAALAYAVVRYYKGWSGGTITSGTEGADHVGLPRHDVDPHDFGLALDLRTSDLPPGAPELLHAILARFFGQTFVWVLEADHLHVQLAAWRSVAGLVA